MRVRSLSLALVAQLSSVAVAAQSVPLTASQVPLTGQTTADFVPRGWRIESRLGGDLNADHQPDSVLVLIEKPGKISKTEDEEKPNRRRTLVVVLAQPAGPLKRVGVGAKALYCTQCLAQLDYPANAVPVVTIEQDRILVRHQAGSGQVLTQTQYYRYDAVTARVKLVVEDYRLLSRSNGKFVSATTDFLTSQQLISRGKRGEAAAQNPPIARSVKVLPPYLEDVNVLTYRPAWLPEDFFD